jgi:hypothetical protein
MAEQILTALPGMTIEEFFRLWAWDEDASITFVRVAPGIRQENVIELLPNGNYRITQKT